MNRSPARAGASSLVLLAYIAFISLGMPDGLLGVAWPSMRAGFGVPLDALGLLIFSNVLGYLLSSFFGGRLVAKLGVGRLLAASCAATGATLLGFTVLPAWWMVVALGAVGGLGAGAIDTGLNTYIAANHGQRYMQWLHASFGVGITSGPLIMTAGLNLFQQWRVGYLAVGTAQLALAGIFALTAACWKAHRSADPGVKPGNMVDHNTALRSTLRQRVAWLSMLLFFTYTGIELTLGYWVYTLLTEARGVAPQLAGLVAGSYWGAFTVGRVLAGFITHRMPLSHLLRSALLTALAGALLLWWNPAQWVSLAGVALVGLAIAPVFPGLVSGTQERVGVAHAANTIGMQISAGGLGVAVLPGLAGAMGRRMGLETIPVFLIASILVLLALLMLSQRKTATGSKQESA